jgi:hypothetical protein
MHQGLNRLPLPMGALHRKVSRLDWNYRFLSCPEGIERQKPDGRRTINQA